MNINLLLILVIIILAAGAVWGWKRGLLESIISMVSCILGIFVLIVVLKGIGNFMQGSYVNVVVAVVLLLAVRIIHKIVDFVMDTFKLVRAIPIGKLADKIAGAALGIIEAVFVIWLMFLVIGSFDIMNLGSWITEQVSQNRFLTMIYYSNYIVELLQNMLL